MEKMVRVSSIEDIKSMYLHQNIWSHQGDTLLEEVALRLCNKIKGVKNKMKELEEKLKTKRETHRQVEEEEVRSISKEQAKDEDKEYNKEEQLR